MDGRGRRMRRLATVAARAGAAFCAVSVVFVVGAAGLICAVGLMRVTAWWAGTLVPTAGAGYFARGRAVVAVVVAVAVAGAFLVVGVYPVWAFGSILTELLEPVGKVVVAVGGAALGGSMWGGLRSEFVVVDVGVLVFVDLGSEIGSVLFRSGGVCAIFGVGLGVRLFSARRFFSCCLL